MKEKIRTINIFIVYYVIAVAIIGIFYIMTRPTQPAQNNTTQDMQQPKAQKHEGPLSVHGAIPYWEQEEGFATFSQNVEQFDYVSLFWYLVQTDQEIALYRDATEDTSIIDFAHQNDVKVLAVITNLPDYQNANWDSNRIRGIISDKESRAKHIQDIMRLLDEKNFDGVNIDYEELDDDLRDEFSLFIKELSDELHQRDQIVGVAIHPKSGENIPSEDNGSRAQDWQAIAASADHLYIMAYGEHWNESAAGPIASTGWDLGLITYAERLLLPLEKVYLGIPLYAVRWEENTRNGEGLLYSDVVQLQQRYNIQPEYDEGNQSPMLTYTENGTTYEVWFENAQSVQAKVKLAKDSGLGGISFWTLGGEDPGVWENLRSLR